MQPAAAPGCADAIAMKGWINLQREDWHGAVAKFEELRALLYATAGEPERFGLDGQTRALIYRTAVETGLRAGELQTLRVAGLESLDGERPTVRVRAIDSKHRREDLLPLRPELARALLAHTSGRGPWEPVFPLPKAWRSAEMLRADLDAAGIAHEDESGRVVDFHALRTTFCTMLARAGVAPKVAQRLARHATFAMTFDVYAKLGADDEREALAVLPDLDAPEREAARGTGTSGEMRPGSVARCVALRGGPHETEGASGSETPPDGEPETAFAGGPCRTRTCDQAIMSRPADPTREGSESASTPTPAPTSAPLAPESTEQRGVECGVSRSQESALSEVIRAWPALSEDVRGRILEAVRAARR